MSQRDRRSILGVELMRMLRAMKRALIGLGVLVVGCGGSSSSDKPAADASTSPDGGSNAPSDSGTQGGTFTLTSTAFAANGAIPVANSCDGTAGSPALAWTGAPSAAKSFALTVIDPDAGNSGFQHWVIYDIPTTDTGLPAKVENAYAPGNVAGAHQTKNQGGSLGFTPPCPPKGDPAHHYHFTLYALDAATLPGATGTTTATQAIASIATHMIAHAELVGTFAR